MTPAEERSLAEEWLLHTCSGQDTVSVSVGEKGTEVLLCGRAGMRGEYCTRVVIRGAYWCTVHLGRLLPHTFF